MVFNLHFLLIGHLGTIDLIDWLIIEALMKTDRLWSCSFTENPCSLHGVLFYGKNKTKLVMNDSFSIRFQVVYVEITFLVKLLHYYLFILIHLVEWMNTLLWKSCLNVKQCFHFHTSCIFMASLFPHKYSAFLSIKFASLFVNLSGLSNP